MPQDSSKGKKGLKQFFQNLVGKLTEPLDERFELTDRLHQTLLDKPVPLYARRYYYCFGGITFFLFVVQVITGIILTIYYVPSIEKAYSSVYYLSHYVNYGWLIRSIHHWSANLIVIFVILHLVRVFMTGSYKPPREFNWVVGMLLLFTTLGFSLTGYLLPWDQKAYWGSTVVTSLIKKVPVIGPTLSVIIVGGDAIGQPTLTRFFNLHVMILPAIIMMFVVVHFWMIRKQGLSRPL